MYKPALDFLAELSLTGYTGEICINIGTDKTDIKIDTILNCGFVQHVADKFNYQADAKVDQEKESTTITLQFKKEAVHA